MILIVLIVAAAACTVVGVLSGSLVPVYVALGLALLGAVVFGVAALRERLSETSGERTSGDNKTSDRAESVEVGQAAEPTEAADAGKLEKPPEDQRVDERPVSPVESAEEGVAAGVLVNGRAKTHGNGSNPETGAVPSSLAEADKVSVDEPLGANQIVYVIPGRKRFHRAGCRILKGRSPEELTMADVDDEGFTACTSCANGYFRMTSQE